MIILDTNIIINLTFMIAAIISYLIVGFLWSLFMTAALSDDLDRRYPDLLKNMPDWLEDTLSILCFLIIAVIWPVFLIIALLLNILGINQD